MSRAIPFWSKSTAIPSKIRVSVKDAGGTLRDLTSYANAAAVDGQDAVVGATWSEDADSHGLNARISLAREVGDAISLAPLADTSPLNKAWATAANQLLAVGRFVQIEAAFCPEDAPASALTWKSVFEGWIDVIDWEKSPIEIAARGSHAPLMDRFFERERVYNYSTDADYDRGAFIFKPSDSYAVGELVLPTDGKRNGHFYEVTAITTGIAGSSEPTWPTGGGSTVVSGGVTFTEKGTTSITAFKSLESTIQAMIDDVYPSSGITLQTPASPSWSLKPWKQSRVDGWTAIRKLVDQIGWDLRFTVREGTSANFALYLYEPDRAAAGTPIAVDVVDGSVRRARIDLTSIRNTIRVWFSDAADLDAGGNPKRKFVEVSDASSITKYGRRFMEVSEASSSNIDTSTEATAFANAILSDLKEPNVEVVIELPTLAWWIQLGDVVTVTDSSDAQRFFGSSSITAGVNSVEYDMTEGIGSTVLGLAGKPAAGRRRWLKLEAARMHQRNEERELHQASGWQEDAAITLTNTAIVGGQRLQIEGTATKHALIQEYEIHVSTSASFTPNSATLVGVSAGKALELGDLHPGRTYYAKFVPFLRNGARIVRGEPSAEISFVAARAKATHLDSDANHGELPLNGGFEHHFDATANDDPPDHWSVTAGAWKTDIDTGTDASGKSGARYLKVKSGTTQRTIESDFFEVVGGQAYCIDAVAAGVSGSDSLNINVQWYTYAKATEGSVTNVIQFDAATTSYERKTAKLVAASAARFGKVIITKNTAGTAGAWNVDHVRVRHIGDDWVDVAAAGGADPSFKNSWVNYNTSTHGIAAARRDLDGQVWLKGLIKDGTVGAVPAFTLPAGWRPAKTTNLAAVTSTGYGRVEIQTNGDVYVLSGGNGFVSLDVSFSTWE